MLVPQVLTVSDRGGKLTTADTADRTLGVCFYAWFLYPINDVLGGVWVSPSIDDAIRQKPTVLTSCCGDDTDNPALVMLVVHWH